MSSEENGSRSNRAQDASPATVTSAAPILLVSDMQRSLAYYRDQLGFTDRESLHGDPPTFAILRRGTVHIMLAEVEPGVTITSNWKLREKTSTVYVWVPDARAIYQEFLDKNVEIDYSLYEAPHGCLEFGVSDPDGHDISFGEVL